MKSNKLKKIVAIAIATTMLSTISPVSVFAAWLKDPQNNWNWTQNGNKAIGWTQVDGTWYHFDGNGKMQTGWVRAADSKWYYMNSDGGMKTGWLQTSDGKWYNLANDGAMKIGWIQETNGKWYFADTSGAMQTGVVRVQGKVYVFETSGVMATGSTIIGGQTYTINASGAITGAKLPTPEKAFTNEGIVIAIDTTSNLSTTRDAIETSTNTTLSSGSSSSHNSSSGSSSSHNSASSSTSSSISNAGTTQAEKVKKAVAAIRNAEDVTMMEKAITDNADLLALDLTSYDRLKDKTQVQKALIGKDFSANTGSNSDVSLFFEKFNIKLAFDDNVYGQYLAEVEPSKIGGAISSQGSGTGEARAKAEWIASIVNSADDKAFEKVITDNAGRWGLDLTEYNVLKDKTSIRKAMIEKLSSRLAGGISDKSPYYFVIQLNLQVKQIFDDAVSTQKAIEVVPVPNKDTTPSTGGSSSGGSTDTTGGNSSNSNSGKTYKQKTEEAVSVIKNAADVIAMEKAITDNAGLLALDLTNYNALIDKTPVQRALIGKDFSANTGSNPDTSLFFVKLNIELAFDEAVYSQRIAETDPDRIGGIISMQGSGLGYTKATAEAIATINNAIEVTKMENAITDKAGVLGLDLTDYNGLKDKIPVLRALIGTFSSSLSDGISSSNPYYFVNNFKSNVKQAFTEAVLAQKTAEAVTDKDTTSTAGSDSTNSSTSTDSGNAGTTQAEKVKKAIAVIKNAADETAMAKAITDNADLLALDLTSYDRLKDKTPVQKALIGKDFSANTGSNPDVSLFFEKFNIKLAFDDKVYDQYLAEVEPGRIGGAISSHGSGTGEPKAKAEWIAAIVNASDETAFEKVITDKASLFGLDIIKYNTLKDKTSVRKAMIEKLSNRLVEEGISTKSLYYFVIDLSSKVKQIFDEAVSAQKTAEQAVADTTNGSGSMSFGNTIPNSYIQKIEEAVVAINNAADVTAMARAITDNAGLLGLDLTDYNLVTDKTPVLKVLIGKGFGDKADVKVAFDAAVLKAFVNEHGISMGYLYANNTYSNSTEKTEEAVSDKDTTGGSSSASNSGIGTTTDTIETSADTASATSISTSSGSADTTATNSIV